MANSTWDYAVRAVREKSGGDRNEAMRLCAMWQRNVGFDMYKLLSAAGFK